MSHSSAFIFDTVSQQSIKILMLDLELSQNLSTHCQSRGTSLVIIPLNPVCNLLSVSASEQLLGEQEQKESNAIIDTIW